MSNTQEDEEMSQTESNLDSAEVDGIINITIFK